MKELIESYLSTALLIWERIEELRAQRKGKFDDDLERRLAILELSLIHILQGMVFYFPNMVYRFVQKIPVVGYNKPVSYTHLAVGLPTLWPRGFITPGALRAAGDARFTLVASLLSMWLVRVMLGYVLAIVFHVGVVGIWIAMVLEWGVRGIIFSLRERRDKWYRHKVIT